MPKRTGAKRRGQAQGSSGDSQDGSAAQRTLAAYLDELKAIRATGAGVPETSYYPALSNLFNAVGGTLKPKVRCVINITDQGAGIPDGGLFTADQFQRKSGHEPKPGQLPARGAIEAKGTKREVSDIAKSAQIVGDKKKPGYLAKYGIVLVTNLRDFLIVERGPGGKPQSRESFKLGANEKDFWRSKVAHPRSTAQQSGEQFVEFIKRACLHAAPLLNPKDVAWFLASYARDALFRVEQQKDLPALQAVRSALEDALGMKFTGDKGEHFFRSTLVQTLFYGVFSAWVRWHRDNPASSAKFDWQKAEWSLHIPFIGTLYGEVAKPNRLGALGLVEVLDWAAGVLDRVDRDEFFKRFQDEHAVQYFYEPFLKAYDPGLRKALGVWFTPREIVKYQVARVDRVLRNELDLRDGLADPNVIVLDPCCGTGAYLVEVLNNIAATLHDKGGDALVASDLKQAAMKRVFGFEILPAPFVVSHLQLGLMLQAQGAPLSQKAGERVAVYLTNALTGWEPPKGVKATKPFVQFPELQDEKDAAEHVKRDTKILVVLGNPPYNAFAGVSPEEEQGLVEVYKGVYFTEKKSRKGQLPKRVRHYLLNDPESRGGWGIKKFNLDELYVRFFRLAERRIAEMSGKGVVSFISNFSYLGDPSFVVMRQRFLSEFDKLWLDCLNGDSRETGKLTPDGKPDPSVFSTDYNREGIRVGTAVCVIVRKPTRQKNPTVRFRHFWGANKRGDLLDSLNVKNIDAAYTLADPCAENRLSFRPENVAAHYTEWPKVADLCEVAPLQGMDEDRGNALIDIDEGELSTRIQTYLDPSVDWSGFAVIGKGLARNSAAFDAQKVRDAAIAGSGFSNANIRQYLYRPLDTRHCYYTSTANVWKRHRPELVRQAWESNGFVLSRPSGVAVPEGTPFLFCRNLLARDSMRGHAIAFPLRVQGGADALFHSSKPHANLSELARAYLTKLGIEDPDADAKTAGLVWMHALSIGYSPAYLTENADGIRRDWPRIPLPADGKALKASAALGEQIAGLLDTEADMAGVTCGRIAPVFKTIGVIAKAGGGQLDPAGGDLAITAGWGHFGKEGVVMPGKGALTERQYDKAEVAAIEAEAEKRSLTHECVLGLLGDKTVDVHLNGSACWRNIPLKVWEYHIGGYQVIKKWLSYREEPILGRPLKPEEAREVANTARRIAAIILLQPKLDENYERVKAASYSWARPSGS